MDQTHSHNNTELVSNSKDIIVQLNKMENREKMITKYFGAFLIDRTDTNNINSRETDQEFINRLNQNLRNLETVDDSSSGVNLHNTIITVSSELQKNFTQICDSMQVYICKNSNFSITNNNIIVKNNNNEKMFEDKMDPAEIVSKNCLLNQLTSIKRSDMMKIIEPRYLKKGNSITMTDITHIKSTTLNKHVNELTANELIKEINCNELIDGIKSDITIKRVNSMMFQKPSTVLKDQEWKSNEDWQNICVTCNTIVNSCIPECTWSQDEYNIYLKFNGLELDSFSANCTMESITFNARYKDKLYTFCAILYGFIRPNISHRTSVEGIQIKARKLYKGESEWPRLFACTKLHTYVKYDSKIKETKEFGIWTKAINWMKMVIIETVGQLTLKS